jgi:hypothetical protein
LLTSRNGHRSSRNCTRIAPERLSTAAILSTITACQSPGRHRQSRAHEAIFSCTPQTVHRGCRVLPGEGCSRRWPFCIQATVFCGECVARRLTAESPTGASPASHRRRVKPMEQVGSIPTAHHKAPSSARGAALTQVRGRMSSVPLRKAMPPMTPAARSCAGTAANRLYDPPCVWLTLRAPGSSNAPLLARSRPTQVFLRCRLAETPMMWGVTGSAMSPPASNGYCVPRKESENE